MSLRFLCHTKESELDSTYLSSREVNFSLNNVQDGKRVIELIVSQSQTVPEYNEDGNEHGGPLVKSSAPLAQ
ncbi:hypothetical protein SK128_007983, partial [Halocaridina rubra]